MSLAILQAAAPGVFLGAAVAVAALNARREPSAMFVGWLLLAVLLISDGLFVLSQHHLVGLECEEILDALVDALCAILCAMLWAQFERRWLLAMFATFMVQAAGYVWYNQGGRTAGGRFAIDVVDSGVNALQFALAYIGPRLPPRVRVPRLRPSPDDGRVVHLRPPTSVRRR